ncbi:hypothetical protein SAMN05216298_3615 [Glycomyces sambucus]|uniref:DUF4352 domain-containing protein n=1 Tax=Glycomyces sambucus TaxID=380244 RepID=A0A1G9JFX7_9ACTN|nr:hypothetical protein [Glycomyces sambucus]SDL36291.1 hypothetical protein SAMN05216298_3615 [Glycomyces sambucus]
MNIEFPEISKRLLAASGAALIGLAALSACSAGEDPASDSDDTGTEESAVEEVAEEEEAATGDGTSPESPLPAGSAVEITDWTLNGTVELDATEAVLAANEFNSEPAEGNQYGLITLEGTYNGTATGTLWLDATFGIWADGTFYDSIDCMNTVENDVMDTAEVSPGSDSSGAACVEIPTGAESYLLYFEDIWSLDGTQYFVEIG